MVDLNWRQDSHLLKNLHRIFWLIAVLELSFGNNRLTPKFRVFFKFFFQNSVFFKFN